jgi:hypothetical protein
VGNVLDVSVRGEGVMVAVNYLSLAFRILPETPRPGVREERVVETSLCIV